MSPNVPTFWPPMLAPFACAQSSSRKRPRSRAIFAMGVTFMGAPLMWTAIMPRVRGVTRRSTFQTAKLLNGSRHWSKSLANVELNGLHSSPLPRVLDINAHMRIPVAANLCRIEAEIAVLKLRVTQSIPERIERCTGHIDITLGMGPTAVDPIRLRWSVVVICRQLSHTASNSDRQSATRVKVTKQDISHCLGPTFPRFPSLDNCGNMLCFPANRKGPAVNQYQNRRYARCLDRPDEVLLHP